MTVMNAPLAVVPSLLGPLQTVILLLPAILLGLVLVMRALVSPSAWRQGLVSAWHTTRVAPFKSLTWLVVLAGGVGLLYWMLQPVKADFAGGDGFVGAENWPTFHGRPNRSGLAVGADLDAPLAPTVRWRFHDALVPDRLPFASSPAVAGSNVLIASDNGKLYCIDIETAQPRWVFEARYPIFSSPAVAGGRVFVGEGLHEHTDSKFYCLNLSDGSEAWSIQTTGHTESSPAVADGKVYFGAGDDGVYCAEVETGLIVWNNRDGHVDGGPLVVGDRVVYGSGYSWNGIFCVNAADGETLWKLELPAPSWSAPSYDYGRVYIAVGNGNFHESDPEPLGQVRCLEIADGSEVWRFTEVEDAVLTAVAVSSGLAVFGSRDGGCYAVDASTGELAWCFDVDLPILSSPAVASGRVVFGADDESLHCLELATGRELWCFDTIDDHRFYMISSTIQSSPALASGRVIFGSSNGNLYCLGSDEADASEPIIARLGYRTRLMRTSDFLAVGLIEMIGARTGSLGWGIVLLAVAVKLLLLPLDWKLSRQFVALRSLQSELDRLRRDYVDYRVLRHDVRALYAQAGIHPLTTLGLALIQVPILIVVVLVLQSTPIFAGRTFFCLADLATPDRLLAIPGVNWPGLPWNVLPVLLAASIWVYAVTLGTPGRRQSLCRRIAWAVAAVVFGVLFYQWPAALLLFLLVLLWTGTIVQSALTALMREPVMRSG